MYIIYNRYKYVVFFLLLLIGDNSFARPTSLSNRITSTVGLGDFEKSIQVDLNFPYYQNRSTKSIVEEIYLAGYKVVRLVVLNENKIDSAFVYELKRKGMQVWLQASGFITYDTNGYPTDWELWKMKLNKEVNGSHGYIFLSPFNQSFIEWRKQKLAYLMKKYPFDGIEITEPYFPGWEAIDKGTYGDIGANARIVFKKAFGEEVPNFSDTTAANYYKKIPHVYQKWINLRVNATNHFLNEVINGNGGIREVRPDALVATWSISLDAGGKTKEKLREYFGIDVLEMLRLIQPDAHIIQTHWIDWIKPELPSDYIGAYQPIRDEIKSKFPNIRVGLQTDIGSLKLMIRSNKWILELEKSARRYGYQLLIMYEYHLGGYIYNDKPVLRNVQRINSDTVILSFSKRMDAQKAREETCYQFRKNKKIIPIDLGSVEVDGNRIILKSADFPNNFEIVLNHLIDTPDLWFFEGFKPLSIPTNTVAIIK